MMHNTNRTIEIRGVSKSYKNRKVVDNVSLQMTQGEIISLLGPNGAGKTTTFYMTVGTIQPDMGTIHMDGKNITSLPMYKRSKMGIGYLPQEQSIFRKLSVEHNIMAVLEMQKIPKSAQKERLEELINEFGLQKIRKNRGDVISGGERRRTEIARSLATNPTFILLDEPFAGIDPIAVEDIQQIIFRLREKKIGILITDHNVRETLAISNRAYILIDGKMFKEGNAEELAKDRNVRRYYLGSDFELKKKTTVETLA